MQTDNSRAAIAAAVIMICFGLTAFYLPTIMLAVGRFSTIVAGAIAVAFVAAFFIVFWLRARTQKRS